MRALIATALVVAGCDRAAPPSGWVKVGEAPSVNAGDPTRITAPADGGGHVHLSSALVELKGGRVIHLDQMWTANLGGRAYLVGTAQGTGSPDVFRGSQTWVALDDVLRFGVHKSAEDVRKAFAAYEAEGRAAEPFSARRSLVDPQTKDPPQKKIGKQTTTVEKFPDEIVIPPPQKKTNKGAPDKRSIPPPVKSADDETNS